MNEAIQPALRDICGRSTRGPWTQSPEGTRVRIGGTFTLTQVGPRGAAPEGWNKIYAERRANAQLIARCNPSTMPAVMEALEAVNQLNHIWERGDQVVKVDDRFIRAKELCRNAIQLLNTPSTPNAGTGGG